MTKPFKNKKEAGASPGTLQYVGRERTQPVQYSAIIYDAKEAKEYHDPPLTNLKSLVRPGQKLWLKVSGVHEVGFIEKLGAQFGIHPLALEDILSTSQRPKVEDYGEYLFIVLRDVKPGTNAQYNEQISLLLGIDFVISFEEGKGGVFEIIRTRLQDLKGKLPVLGSDYLAYRILDCVVDSYFAYVAELEEKIDQAEENLLKGKEKALLESIFNMRQETVVLKKAILPLRDFQSFFRNSDSSLLSQDISVFLMDFADHVTRVTEAVEACRENLSGMMDLYVSLSDRKLNEVMKVLTVISTIFIPLGFLTSYFGMNFKGMFEYELPFAYPIFAIALVSIVVLQLMFFKKKGWI